jgi:hypothetical protein
MAKFIAVLNNKRLFRLAQNDMQKIFFLKIKKLPKLPLFATSNDDKLKHQEDIQTDL